jgi:tRNA (cmo5U34)-methyltransferase
MSRPDNYSPGAKWAFDDGVAQVFPDMLKRSIPGYSTMRDCVVRVAKPFLESANSEKYFLDIGCSRGDVIYDVLNSLSSIGHVQVVGVDSSKPMIDLATESFSRFTNVSFVHADATNMTITPGKYSVITSVLTAQFLPLDTRQEFFEMVHSGLSHDGAFIVVEKILGETPKSQAFLVDNYHIFKKDNGYSEEQVEQKRKSLQGVLVPLRGSENESMLKDAGFSCVQRFWQCLNFAGWIAFK